MCIGNRTGMEDVGKRWDTLEAVSACRDISVYLLTHQVRTYSGGCWWHFPALSEEQKFLWTNTDQKQMFYVQKGREKNEVKSPTMTRIASSFYEVWFYEWVHYVDEKENKILFVRPPLLQISGPVHCIIFSRALNRDSLQIITSFTFYRSNASRKLFFSFAQKILLK